MCLVFKVSRSSFYYWLSCPESKRRNENIQILETIKAIRQSEPKKEVYGALRMLKDLKAKGFYCGKNRIAAIMRKNGIRSKIKRKFKRTTDSEHSHPVAPNILQQRFSVDAPNKAYVTDITYIWTAEGWLYLAVVLDLFSRMVVGWFTSSRINKELVREALQRAIKERKPQRGLIVHSDRGSQYASHEYRTFLNKRGYMQSMSGSGNCYDNAVMESFFHSLKVEHIFFEKYATRAEAKTSIFDYIETFYNRVRRHSHLNYEAPLLFEQNYVKAA
jgi:transposase InsO family protein